MYDPLMNPQVNSALYHELAGRSLVSPSEPLPRMPASTRHQRLTQLARMVSSLGERLVIWGQASGGLSSQQEHQPV